MKKNNNVQKENVKLNTSFIKQNLIWLVIIILLVILGILYYAFYIVPNNNKKGINFVPVSVYMEGSEKSLSSDETILVYTDEEGKVYSKTNGSSKVITATGIEGKVTKLAGETSCGGPLAGEHYLVALTENGEVYINKYSAPNYTEGGKIVSYPLSFIKLESDSKIKDIEAIEPSKAMSCSHTYIYITKENNVKYGLQYNSTTKKMVISSKSYADAYPFKKVYGWVDNELYILADDTVSYNNYTTIVVDENNKVLKNIKFAVTYVPLDDDKSSWEGLYIISSNDQILYISSGDKDYRENGKMIARKYNNKTVREYQVVENGKSLSVTYNDNTKETIKLN